MDEPLFSKAWSCGESDCESGWHEATYWMNITGKKESYSVDSYSDGDHEDCDQVDLPTNEQVKASWEEYAADCLITGKDPLGQYRVKSKKTTNHQWQVKFGISILGIKCLGLRRRGRGRWISPNKIPQDVAEYLCIRKFSPNSSNWIFDDGEISDRHRDIFDRLRRLAEEDGDVKIQNDRNKLHLKLLFSVDEERELTPKVYSRKLRELISQTS